jgi:hypothetical protein
MFINICVYSYRGISIVKIVLLLFVTIEVILLVPIFHGIHNVPQSVKTTN